MIGVVKVFYPGVVCSLICVLFLFLISCSKDNIYENITEEPSIVYSSLELELLNLINEHRTSKGQNKLGTLNEISAQAQLHSEHMQSTREVCHHNFGSRYLALVETLGAKSVGENVGYGYRTSEALFLAWLNSSTHRKIIEGDNTHFGISALKADDTSYVTLIFIRR